MRLAIVVSALLLVPAAGIAAQGNDLTPGARVRVTSSQYGYKRDVATVSQLRGDSVVLLFDGKPVALALSDLNQIQVSAGTRNAVLPTAMLGGLAGFVGGAILGVALHEDCDGCFFETSASEDAMIVGSIMGLGGILGGAIVGTFLKRDRWTTMSVVPARISVAPAPRGGVQLSMSRSF